MLKSGPGCVRTGAGAVWVNCHYPSERHPASRQSGPGLCNTGERDLGVVPEERLSNFAVYELALAKEVDAEVLVDDNLKG